MKLLEKHELTLLGSPILPEAIKTVLNAKIESLKLMTERLTTIGAHEALFLLRNCFSIPKLTYFLRTAPCFMERSIMHKYDNYIKDSLQKILNIHLEEPAWNQSTLPVNLGGLGIKMASEVSLPAYLSSVSASMSTVKAMIPVSINDHQDSFYRLGSTEWMIKLNRNTLPENPLFQEE